MKNVAVWMVSALLLPVMGSCSYLHAGQEDTGAIFEYRDIYLPGTTKEEDEELELNNVSEDWGVWGHNLGNILPEDASKQIYAHVQGGYNKDQYCFSSPKLYDYIVEYIQGEYLFSDTINFAILPNDNDIVCLCTECVSLGNKPGNASPAVMNMIEKLAKKFPEHQFFTSYYSTTSDIPEKRMPSNTGVLVSAMSYPLSAIETPKEKEFMDLLRRWSEKTDNVYIWDYVNNFDDYFTPVPVFSVMQRRFRQYRDAGVKGIFLNGSGHDYSSFGKLKKTVLAKLLLNPDQDWEELLRKYAKEYYPVAGDHIVDFIVAQEKMIEENGKRLPLYEGMNTAVTTYLPERQFVEFYNNIVADKKVAEGDEKADLKMLANAMALTMLEIKRLNHDLEGTDHLKERLARLPAMGIDSYNEGCWSISTYLKNYNFMEEDAQATAGSNLLKGVTLHPRTALDEDYQDISILTDGQLGMPHNYHNGMLITSADPAFSISIPRVPGMKKIKLWMVYNPGFKIGLPMEAYLTVDGLKRAAQEPPKPTGGSGHSFLEFDVPPSGDIILTLKKDPEVKTMAIDEIQAF